jgi:CRISPR system Cascade subunit CasE
MQSFHEATASANGRGCVILRKKAFAPALKTQDSLRFLLCANPIKRLVKERCRVPLIDEDQLIAWLRQKLTDAAVLENADIIEKRNLYFRKDGKAGKIVTVTFSGQIAVSDPVRMHTVLEKGIGPAKAFGCGLLSLARA